MRTVESVGATVLTCSKTFLRGELAPMMPSTQSRAPFAASETNRGPSTRPVGSLSWRSEESSIGIVRLVAKGSSPLGCRKLGEKERLEAILYPHMREFCSFRSESHFKTLRSFFHPDSRCRLSCRSLLNWLAWLPLGRFGDPLWIRSELALRANPRPEP